MKHIFLAFLICQILLSCERRGKQKFAPDSELKISHHEGTEYLDAYVDSGSVVLSDDLKAKLDTDRIRITGCPSFKDLYLISEEDTPIYQFNKINLELFGDQNNYTSKWNNQYWVTGNVVGIRGCGLIFKVQGYRKI